MDPDAPARWSQITDGAPWDVWPLLKRAVEAPEFAPGWRPENAGVVLGPLVLRGPYPKLSVEDLGTLLRVRLLARVTVREGARLPLDEVPLVSWEQGLGCYVRLLA